MAPVAAAGLVMLAATVLMGYLVGAVAGAVVRVLRWPLVPGALLAAGGFLLLQLTEHPQDLRWSRGDLVFGLPSVWLAFLVCSVTDRLLVARLSIQSIWVTVVAFAITLIVGVLYMLLFRIDFWMPIWLAISAIVLLTLLLIRLAKRD